MSKNEQTNPLVQNIKKISLSSIDDFLSWGLFESNIILQLFKPTNNIGSEAVIAAGPGIDIFPKRSGSVCHIAEKSDNVFKSFLLKACPH